MIIPTSLLGASVSRDKFPLVRHRGTCVDLACNYVVDTTPETGARTVPFQVFAANQQVTVDSQGFTWEEQQVRATRALSMVGKLPYAKANCDHLATYAETGVFDSPQLNSWIVALGLGAMLFVGLKAVAK